MGNYRFRLSDMIPNAWFYKLKDMSKSRKQFTGSQPSKKKPSKAAAVTSQKPNISHQRYSYYFTTEPGFRAGKFHFNSPVNPKASDTRFPDPPRKSSNRRRSKRKTIYKPSPKPVSSSPDGCSCHATVNPVLKKSIPGDYSPDYSSSPLESSHDELDFLSESDEDDSFLVPDSLDHHQVTSWSSSCNCNVSSSTDIIIDMNGGSFERKIEEVDQYSKIAELQLPPILTKPEKFPDKTNEGNEFGRTTSKLEEIKAHRSLSVKVVKEESIRTHKEQKINPPTRKSSANSTGIKLRSNTPRIASKRIQTHARKSVSTSRNKNLSESFAVVKSSVDPQKDFKDSMVEMIVENNIRASKDLEDLLACYLSLNSKEYHDVIVKAFEQIWFDMTDEDLHL